MQNTAMIKINNYVVITISIILLLLMFVSCGQSVDNHENGTSVIEPDNTGSVIDAATADNNEQETPLQTPPDLGSKIVNYAGTLIGVPYKEAGRDSSGFDCSGFVYYVFKKYNMDIPHSSRHMAALGEQIAVEEAKEGDLVFFRGTDPASNEVGHVGIVVSGTGEKIKFIHSSSAKSSPCVRVDSLEKPNYQKRFLMVKRVL